MSVLVVIIFLHNTDFILIIYLSTDKMASRGKTKQQKLCSMIWCLVIVFGLLSHKYLEEVKSAFVVCITQMCCLIQS